MEDGVPVGDGAFQAGQGCYTTGRAEQGRLRHLERHVARLRRDAAQIGLGELEAPPLEAALRQLAREAFPDGRGVVRLQASRDDAGALHLVGTTRPLEPDPQRWRARVASFPHEGAAPWRGAKVTSRLRLVLAAEEARSAGVEEAILLDAAGRAVEGARSSLVVVDERGVARTPPLARGGVAGLARAILLERIPELREQDVSASALRRARELVAVNAVRGARPIVALDGRTLGNGREGAWARRLASALEPE